MKLKVYTDASFDLSTRTAACGYVVISEGEPIKHEVILLSEMPTSQSAECYSVYLALLEAIKYKPTHIEIRCDCQAVIHLWQDKIKQRTLNRSKCMTMLKEVMDGLKASYAFITFRKVKAHSACEMNNKVDKSVRHQLRKYLKAA